MHIHTHLQVSTQKEPVLCDSLSDITNKQTKTVVMIHTMMYSTHRLAGAAHCLSHTANIGTGAVRAGKSLVTHTPHNVPTGTYCT